MHLRLRGISKTFGKLVANRAAHYYFTGFGPDVSAATRSRILAQGQAIKSGRLNIWSGPVYGQDGSALVANGKALSFGQLESMNYFVKGVQGTLK